MNYWIFLIYGAVIIFFIWKIFFAPKGQKVKIILYRWVNKKRIFDKVVIGIIRKRIKDSPEEQLFIKLGPRKIWQNIPDSINFMTDMKGKITIHGVIDSVNNISWIRPIDTIYKETVEKYQDPILDKDGKPKIKEVYVKDEITGEIVTEPVLENGKQVMDEQGRPLFKPKVENVPDTKTKERKVQKASPYDQVIENDVGLYYLNKKIEIREKFKREENKSLLEKAMPFAIAAVVILGVAYLSYQHLKEMNETAEQRADAMLGVFNKIMENPTALNPMKRTEQKDENIGQEVDQGQS